MEDKLTAERLKEILWKNLKDLESKTINIKEANAITSCSREILRIVATELNVARLTDVKPSQDVLDFANVKAAISAPETSKNTLDAPPLGTELDLSGTTQHIYSEEL